MHVHVDTKYYMYMLVFLMILILICNDIIAVRVYVCIELAAELLLIKLQISLRKAYVHL